MMMRQQPDIQFKFINSLKIKAPGGLFSFSYYYKYLLFTFFITSFVCSNEKQSFGFIAYNSNKWNNSIVKSHNNDIYNNGFNVDASYSDIGNFTGPGIIDADPLFCDT